MHIEDFLSNFNDIIPFQFKLEIGGSRASSIITDKKLISDINRKGKLYPFYTKNIHGVETKYIPLEKFDTPIKLSIEYPYPHYLKWEIKASSTKKEWTRFEVRILSRRDLKQLGYLALDLTPAGDIGHKYCSYYNANGSHEIVQSIDYNYNEQTKKVIPFEKLSYIFYNLETDLEESVVFRKENGVLKCITVNREDINNCTLKHIVLRSEDIDKKREFFSRFYNIPYTPHISNLACDMTNYIIDYLLDSTTFRELGFNGLYVGNTIIKKDNKTILIIESLCGDYHYFISTDITGTDIFDDDIFSDTIRSVCFYQKLQKSGTKPIFRLKVIDSKEILVPFGEEITDEELKNYEMFKSFCFESFSTIKKEKMAVLSLSKHSKN